jgi:hypothetical protein
MRCARLLKELYRKKYIKQSDFTGKTKHLKKNLQSKGDILGMEHKRCHVSRLLYCYLIYPLVSTQLSASNLRFFPSPC